MLRRRCSAIRGGGNFAFYCIWMFPDFMAVKSTTAAINTPAVKILHYEKIVGLLDQVDHICIT